MVDVFVMLKSITIDVTNHCILEIDSAVAEYTATALNRRRIEEASLKRSSFAEDAEAAHEYHKTKKSKASQ
jgi:hypothetical protein